MAVLVSICLIIVLLLALIVLSGFGPGGIAAGSFAAKLMSILAPIKSGSLVAILQSLGAAGIFSPLRMDSCDISHLYLFSVLPLLPLKEGWTYPIDNM